MPIDSAAKRRSIVNLTNITPGVTPNATPDSAWRIQVGYSYSGLTLEAPAVVMNFGLIASSDVGMKIDPQDIGTYVKWNDVGMHVIRGD